MPRSARKQSSTNIYHAILRGNNKQQIFFDDEDYQKFLFFLQQQKTKWNCKIYAWCLMSNHVHLVLKEDSGSVSRFFQGLGSNYVYWYNRKYDRCGHLFEGRYKSEPIEDDVYFLRVIRYVHLNPVKCGICKNPEEFPYSSYTKFFSDKHPKSDDLLFGFINRDEFFKYHLEKTMDKCLDID